MDSLNSPSRQTCVLWGALAAYALILVLGLVVHEPWRDESQLWLPARDLTLGELFGFARYDGHPSLAWLVMMPVAKFGWPLLVGRVLNVLIACAAAGVLLFAAPFRTWQKLILLFGSALIEPGWMLRPYALATLLTLLAAWVWPSRDRRPFLLAIVLIAMANSQTVSAGASLALGALWYWELLTAKRDTATPRHWLAAGLLALGGGLFLIQMWPPQTVHVEWNLGSFTIARGLMLLSLAAGLIALHGRPALQLAAVVALLPAVAIDLGVWGLSVRHVGLYIVFLTSLLWIAAVDRTRGEFRVDQPQVRLFFAAMAILIVPAGVLIWRDCRGPYSPGAAMAAHIRSLPADTVIVAHPPVYTAVTLLYLPTHRLWYAETGAWGTYARYFQVPVHEIRTSQELIDVVDEQFRESRPHVLLNEPIDGPARFGYRLVAREAGIKQTLWLYAPD